MPTQPLHECVASRRLGRATIAIVSGGSLPWAPRFQVPEEQWRRAIPDADAYGKVTLGLNCALISIDGATVVVDPGFDDPHSSWQQRFAERWPGMLCSPGLQASLASLNIHPNEVTHVVISHTHEDHFAGVTAEQGGRSVVRFPRARHFLGRSDWEGNPLRQARDSELVARLGAIERLGLLDLVDGEHEILPSVVIIPAPGETPGHTVVRVQSADDVFYYLGDLFHLPCEVDHLDWVPGQSRDQASTVASRRRVIADAVASRATLVFTHGQFPPWGRIERAGEGYRWIRIV